METNVNLTNAEQQEEEMQLVPLIKLCYHQFKTNWAWFLLSVVICVAIGWFYLQRQPRVFQRQSVMLIEDGDDGAGSSSFRSGSKRNGMNTLLQLNGVSVGDNLKNEIFILSSKRLMQRVVDKLQLDVDYSVKESLHQAPLYAEARPVMLLFEKPYKGKAAQTLQLKKKDGNVVTLCGMTDRLGNAVKDVNAQLGQTVETPYGRVSVVRGPAYGKWGSETIHVTRLSSDNTAAYYMNELTVSEYDKETSLIVMSCNDGSTKRADDILNTLYETYKEDVVENKNRVALSTAKFIDDRIKIIGSELSNVESQLASFKKRNQLIDFTTTPQTILTQTTQARQQSLEMETQLNVAKYLNDYIHNHTNDHDLIPALNLGDASFNTQISAYNDQMNRRNQMVANSSENVAMVRELDRQLQQMRQAIATSLRNYVNTQEVRLRDARANEAALSGRVTGAPEQEKQGLDIQRQQSLKEALYTYLLNKREEVALQQAINEANVRLVEGPIGNKKVSPRGSIIMLVSLVIGLLIPSVVLWLRYMLDVTVHGRRDIEENTTIPLLGEIPHLKDSNDKTLLTDLSSDAPVVEAFRILRFSLGYMRHSTQVMMTTSTTPGQGKSFVSRNMATILAMAGKRVILIDADIRKRTLSSTFGHAFGLTTYLADDHTQVDDIIRPDGLTKGVDFIPAGHMPPNPSELLMSSRFDELIAELRKRYDHVIIDTTPMFSVADASVVARLVDFTLFVIRVGVQNRDFLPELERMYQDNRFRKLSIVLNDADVKTSRYGGGTGYGYGYGYGYGHHKKQSRVQRILGRFKG